MAVLQIDPDHGLAVARVQESLEGRRVAEEEILGEECPVGGENVERRIVVVQHHVHPLHRIDDRRRSVDERVGLEIALKAIK